MRWQERCTDPDRVARYETEINQLMENIEKYRGQLEGLEQKTQQSNGHVDALLGNEEKSESEEDDADSDN
jgi:DNA repair ATPase RecN